MPKTLSGNSWGKLLRWLLLAVAILFFLISFYFWQLGSNTDGFSPAEAEYIASNRNWQDVKQTPIYAPHRLAQLALLKSNLHSQFMLRTPSVGFMLIFLGLYYVLLKLWFGRTIALLGVLLLAGTPWVVLVAKSAVPDILLLTPLTLISVYLWLNRRQSKLNLMCLIMAGLIGVAMYIPGMLWVIVAALVAKHRQIRQIISKLNPYAIVGAVIMIISFSAPLLKAVIDNPSILKQLLLIPQTLPNSLETAVNMAKSIAWAAASLVWRLPYPSDLTVGRLPLVTISLLALAAFGIFAMWTRARRQTYGLVSLIVASIFFAGINFRLTLLLPAVMVLCIFAAAGLRYLYVEWNGIFPKNPIPRYTVIILMSAVITLHLFYGFRYAQIAWPKSPATKRVYVVELKD